MQSMEVEFQVFLMEVCDGNEWASAVALHIILQSGTETGSFVAGTLSEEEIGYFSLNNQVVRVRPEALDWLRKGEGCMVQIMRSLHFSATYPGHLFRRAMLQDALAA